MELREFAEQVLLSNELDTKLDWPTNAFTDSSPGEPLRVEVPGRPDDLLFAERRTAPGMPKPGAFSDPIAVVGQEARIALYAGRPIKRGDVRPPAVITRNALVELVYRRSGLEIRAEGRALGRAAVGEFVSVLNTGSRGRVTGRVMQDGRVVVE